MMRYKFSSAMESACLITLALTLLLSSIAAARAEGKTLNDRSAAQAQTATFMDHVSKDDITGAYQSMRNFLGVPADAFDKAGQEAAKYFKQVHERAGETLSTETVKAESIADDFYRISSIQKFPAAAIAWQFTFYQPTDGWKLVGVTYTTDLEALYKDESLDGNN